MTRIARLYAGVAANPRVSLSYREFERLLAAFGFRLDRIKGSHHHYVHPDVPTILTVLPDGKGVKAYQVRRFLDIVDEFGLRFEE